MTLGFGGQLSSRKGEVQRLCYRLPAYCHYRSSFPLYLTLPTDHLALLHSARLLTRIFKRTATYIHIHHPPFLGITGSWAPAPSLQLLAETSRFSSERQPKGCHQHRRMGLNSRSNFLYSFAYISPHTHSVYSEAILCVHRCGRPRSPGSSLNPQWIKQGGSLVHKDTVSILIPSTPGLSTHSLQVGSNPEFKTHPCVTVPCLRTGPKQPTALDRPSGTQLVTNTTTQSHFFLSLLEGITYNSQFSKYKSKKHSPHGDLSPRSDPVCPFHTSF